MLAGADVAGADVAGADVAGPDVAGPDVAGAEAAELALPPGWPQAARARRTAAQAAMDGRRRDVWRNGDLGV